MASAFSSCRVTRPQRKRARISPPQRTTLKRLGRCDQHCSSHFLTYTHTHTLTPHPCPAHCQAVRELADDTEDDAWESKVKDRSKHSLLPTFTCVPVGCNAFCVILLQDLANTYLAFVSKEERHASFYTVLGALNCARSSPWVAPNLWPRND